ncbi:HAD family acid phosphatase, partial [Legionella pneumophila]|nr:HAD family acid phosphatase [Legionella pneumophila]
LAQEYIHQQYLINKNNKHPQKLAIVLDIDETSLSNYDKMVKRDFTGSKESLLPITYAKFVIIYARVLLYRTYLPNQIFY